MADGQFTCRPALEQNCLHCGKENPADRIERGRKAGTGCRFCSDRCQRRAGALRRYATDPDVRRKALALTAKRRNELRGQAGIEIRRKWKRAQRARYIAAGLNSDGKPRKIAPRGSREGAAWSTPLWEENARQAWRWWLQTCPDWWLSAYYQAQGRPWNNPRLTDAQQAKLKWDHDPRYRLYHRLKRWVNKHLREGRPSVKWSKVLGYSIDDLHAHIEAQFVDGMGWHNMGQWHVDHIRPVNTFQFESADDPQFRECMALQNLRPLWARDNLRRPKDGSDVCVAS